jgi:hypothetical protein
LALQQFGSYLGHTGRAANVIAKAALDRCCRKSPPHPADTQQSNHRSRLVESSLRFWLCRAAKSPVATTASA